MQQVIQTIIVAIIGSAAFTEITKSILNRIKEAREKKSGGTFEEKVTKGLDNINEKLDKVNVEEMRTHILLMLGNKEYRKQVGDISKLAETYCSEPVNGDTYIIPLLVEWYDERKEQYPDWLVKAYERHNCDSKIFDE